MAFSGLLADQISGHGWRVWYTCLVDQMEKKNTFRSKTLDNRITVLTSE